MALAAKRADYVQLVSVACARGLAASPLRDQVHGRGHQAPSGFGCQPCVRDAPPYKGRLTLRLRDVPREA